MEKLLEFIVKAIVTQPKKVKITPEEGEGGFINFNLEVDPEDLKIVIGRKGRTIRAIRNLLRLRAISEGKRVGLQLEESGPPPKT